MTTGLRLSQEQINRILKQHRMMYEALLVMDDYNLLESEPGEKQALAKAKQLALTTLYPEKTQIPVSELSVNALNHAVAQAVEMAYPRLELALGRDEYSDARNKEFDPLTNDQQLGELLTEHADIDCRFDHRDGRWTATGRSDVASFGATRNEAVLRAILRDLAGEMVTIDREVIDGELAPSSQQRLRFV